jgi:hypothetical protein
MSNPSYSDIRDRIGREFADLTEAAAREAVIEHLSLLTFELNRIKEHQRALLAAVRARDILVRDRNQTEIIAPAGSIDLDPRDALDAAAGLYDIEWDNEVAYRWTGPSHDTLIRVWLDRALPVVCEIAVRSYGDERNRGAIALTVDGVPVAIAERGDKLLRSDPFALLSGSLYTELGIHVPWLTGAVTTGNGAGESRTGGGRRGRRSRTDRSGASSADDGGDARVRGIAISHLQFLSPT